MISWDPSAMLADAPDDRGERSLVSAALDETTRCVIAERVTRADTRISRLAGLAGRDMLLDGEALWIAPCKAIHTMGTSFPVDVIFLDADLRVVALREGVRPWRATRRVRSAASALGLPAGAIRRAGVSVGNQLGFVPAHDA